MPKLSTKKRNAIPKARAPQPLKGGLSPVEKSMVVAKASRMLSGKG